MISGSNKARATPRASASIALTELQIETALPQVATGLRKYLWLQSHRDTCDLRADADYRRRFNHFYRVRRGPGWQDAFYDLLERSKGGPVPFVELLEGLHRSTGRYEASFASKLLATIDPDMPVIDSIVLRNLGLRLPAAGSTNRSGRIADLHNRLVSLFSECLATDAGRYLVDRFRATYQDANITETKMLDLVLWQTRTPAG